ncbi:MAG: YceI family protein [Cytophagales bacterium]|nr:YceI family protein [Cytophagales bacterium]
MKQHNTFFLTFCFALVCNLSIAQHTKLNVLNDETKMTVSGTSTLHDWTSEVNTVNGFVEIGEKILKKGKMKSGDVIPSVSIVIPVKSIVSPRGATMDKKTYNALKSEEHPEIKFDLKNSEVSTSSGADFEVKATGKLTIAGVTKDVEFPVEGKILSSDKLSFSGAYKLNMVEYDMEPPSAMFGQIETGEEVEIKFELIVKK